MLFEHVPHIRVYCSRPPDDGLRLDGMAMTTRGKEFSTYAFSSCEATQRQHDAATAHMWPGLSRSVVSGCNLTPLRKHPLSTFWGLYGAESCKYYTLVSTYSYLAI